MREAEAALAARGKSRSGAKNGDCHQFAPRHGLRKKALSLKRIGRLGAVKKSGTATRGLALTSLVAARIKPRLAVPRFFHSSQYPIFRDLHFCHGLLARPARFFALALVVALTAPGCGPSPEHSSDTRMIILGVDGMDPKFLERHWDALPNLDRLRRQGDFKPLATTNPPQSPVAWSSMITGMDPGGHGIFDFVHRDPFTRLPFSSMAETREAGRTWEIGPYVIPLSSGTVSINREGTPFWPMLAEQGVPVTMIRMPANFPPVECEAVALSGMGTPDMRGTYGTFTFVTDDPGERTRSVSGGEIIGIPPFGHRAEITIEGPTNTFLKDRPKAFATLTVHRDPSESVARFDLDDQSLVVQEGEWSGWMRADFPLLGELKSASGIFRLYLKQLRPRFQLYITPINLDPSQPELPISTPASYSCDVTRELGPFYTQGMAEDTSALRQGVLSLDEFIAQTELVLDESRALFRRELGKFDGGLLFFYFSSIDQNAHMLWGRHDDKLLKFYRSVDEAVGEAMSKIDDSTTLIVMSDHGFTRFERGVHLNTILMREGFLALDDPSNTGSAELFAHVDWSRTEAYAMGLNSIYLNLLGRERGGIVSEGEESEQVIARLSERLIAFRDPANGAQVIEEVYTPQQAYRGYNLKFAPDLIIGYRPPYRASWKTPLGGVPDATVEDNEDAWIGDHCVAPKFVPGVFLSNRKSSVEDPALPDLTVTILAEFGMPAAPEMVGRRLF